MEDAETLEKGILYQQLLRKIVKKLSRKILHKVKIQAKRLS
jgi:hypothetical protein